MLILKCILEYLRDYKYLDIQISRYTVFGIGIQFLIWKYVLKSYFVIIMPKYAFFKVRQICLTKKRTLSTMHWSLISFHTICHVCSFFRWHTNVPPYFGLIYLIQWPPSSNKIVESYMPKLANISHSKFWA